MAGISPILFRTTPLMLSNQLYARLSQTQADLLKQQEAISTGKNVNRPSDAADKASAILYLRQQLAARAQYGRNMDHAVSLLNNTDQALADANGILLEAKRIASSQIGVGSDTVTRRTEAQVVASQVQALIEIGNRQFNDISLFGGNRGAAAGGKVFEEFLGGVRYRGGVDNLKTEAGRDDYSPFTSNGLDAFGALSNRVKTNVDLAPQAVASTRISDVGGAAGSAVRKGTVVVDVDGTTVNVDLTTADTLGDVVTRINDAIASIDGAAGSLALNGQGFELTAAAAHTITISDMGGGKAAGDLGINLSATAATTAGPSVEPRITRTTRLADLGGAVDWASGLRITQGEVTKVADFSGAQTVEDLINVVEELELGVRLEINADGTGLDMISEVSGVELSIGENGGTTAQDLGIRTYGLDTKLADFRDGLGVMNIDGEPEFSVTLHDGTSFDVDLDGVTDVQGLINAVQTAAVSAGVTVGADFDVQLATTGNGLVFTDNTAGGGSFQIQNVGLSLAADHLGIKTNAGSGNTITGDDVSKVRVHSLFTDLIDLRNALNDDDTNGITLAGSRLEDGLDNVAASRARVGVDTKRIESQQQRSEDLELSEKTMLSNLQDADLTEVISRYAQLQLQLEASMQVGAQNLQLSLLDFLR